MENKTNEIMVISNSSFTATYHKGEFAVIIHDESEHEDVAAQIDDFLKRVERHVVEYYEGL